MRGKCELNHTDMERYLRVDMARIVGESWKYPKAGIVAPERNIFQPLLRGQDVYRIGEWYV